MTTILTTTLYSPIIITSSDNTLGQPDYSAKYTHSSDNMATVQQQVTKTLSSVTGTNLEPAMQVPNETKSNPSVTIGLAIGLPVGLFCLGLILFLCYFYLGWFGRHDGKSTEAEKHFGNGDKFPTIENLISSKIQYKISKPINLSADPPKAPVYKNPTKTVSSIDIKKDVDKFLYSRPPNIHHIESRITSSNNLAEEGRNFDVVKQVLVSDSAERGLEGATSARKWTYQSPLSKWFLRNSTYMDDGFSIPVPIKTPRYQLKHLKILSSIQKDYAENDPRLQDEMSPILEKVCSSSHFRDNADTNNSQNVNAKPAKILPPALHLYGSLKSESHSPRSSEEQLVTLDPRPPKRFQKHEKLKEIKLEKHLKQITELKPLPSTPGYASRAPHLAAAKVYKVIGNYEAKLVDEINVLKGEYVKILTTHTDGWCLAEKCNEKGQSTTGSLKSARSSSAETVQPGDPHYLNCRRGIIPRSCVVEAQT